MDKIETDCSWVILNVVFAQKFHLSTYVFLQSTGVTLVFALNNIVKNPENFLP